jgi:ADP-ribose pyrophosphatase
MIKPWRTVSSRTIVSDRWLTLRADACELPNGHVLNPYYVLERPSWVSIVALTPDRQVILTNEFRQGAEVIALGLPGGVIEKDELPVEAAAREFLEETGYACAHWTEIGTCFANWKSMTSRIHIVLGEGAVLEADQALDPGEDIEVVAMAWERWLDVMTQEPSQAYYVAASFMAERLLARAASGAS